MKNLNKIISFLLAFVVAVSMLGVSSSEVSAATSNKTLLQKNTSAKSYNPIRYNFSLNRDSELKIKFNLGVRSGLTVKFKDPVQDTEIVTKYLSTSGENFQYNSSKGVYTNSETVSLEKGDYVLELVFETDMNFEMSLVQLAQEASLSSSKLTVTKGFSSTIKVSGDKIKSCTSSNKSVATVSNSGKVTGKSVGTAKISVKLKSGKKLTCKVTVKKNVFSATEINVSNTIYDTCDMQAYKAEFDSKGNLTIKFKIANNRSGKVSSISNFKIVVKDSSSKTIATYSSSSYAASINSFADKGYSVTISKSKLKKNFKSVDLRKSKITISGDVQSSGI
jgi:hypothetical protein